MDATDCFTKPSMSYDLGETLGPVMVGHELRAWPVGNYDPLDCHVISSWSGGSSSPATVTALKSGSVLRRRISIAFMRVGEISESPVSA